MSTSRSKTRIFPLPPALALVGHALAAVLAFPPPAPADDWPAYRGGPACAGVTAECVTPPLSPAWDVALPGRILASPVVAGGRCFVATDEGRVCALSAADGRILWVFTADGSVEGTPAVDGDALYVGTLDGTLHALRAATGEAVWNVRHGGAQESSPLVLRDRVVVAVGRPTNALRAYAKTDGALLWSFNARRPLDASGTLCRAGGRELVVAGDQGGIWSVIDAQAGPLPGGLPLWSFLVPHGQRAPTAAASVDGLLAVCPGGADRRIYVVDPARRAVARRLDAAPPAAADDAAADAFDALLRLPPDALGALFPDGAAGDGAALDLAELLLDRPLDALRSAIGSGAASEALPPVFDGGTVFVLRRERTEAGDSITLVRAGVETGQVEGWWASGPLSPGPVWAPVLSGRHLYVAAGAELMVFDARVLSAGPVARVALPSPAASAPAVSDGRVFVAGADGRVVALESPNHPPGAPALLEPAAGANVQSHFPVFRWSAGADPDGADAPGTLAPTLEVVVEPGGALQDANGGRGAAPGPESLSVTRVELPPGAVEYAPPSPVAANARVTWRVRLRDAAGAASPWSAPGGFVVCYDPDPPDPPAAVSVMPLDGAVQLAWTPSASPDVAGYNIHYKGAGRSFSQSDVVRLGNVTSAAVGRLENREEYDFLVTAVDGAGNESAGVVVSAAPRPDVALDGGAAFPSIQQAIDAAAPGGTVLLGPKTFRVAGGLVLKGGVSLRGYAPHLTILDGQGAPVVLRLAGTAADGRVSVEQLTVTGGGAGIDTGDADALLRNLQVVQLAGPGIVTGPLGALEAVCLTVADNAGDGLDVRTPLAALRGLIVARNGRSGVAGRPGTAVSYSNFFGNPLGPATGFAFGAAAGKPADDALSVPVAFRDTASFDYRERTGDAVVDAGHPEDPYELEPEPNGKRSNQGAFGNTPYAAKSMAALPLAAADGDAAAPQPDGAGAPLCFAVSAGRGAGGALPAAAAFALLACFAIRRTAARRS